MEEVVTPTNTVRCPYCAESISQSAKKCKHCGEILDPQMREIDLLKSQRVSPQVFMNSGGAAAAASAAASGLGGLLWPFPHWLHILLSIITGGLWLPVYLLMYIFRNKRYYY